MPVVKDLLVAEWQLAAGLPAERVAALRGVLRHRHQPLEGFPLTHALEALLAARSGDTAGVEAALDHLPPDRRVGARYFLVDRDPDAVQALLEAHVAQYCEALVSVTPTGVPLPQPTCPKVAAPPPEYAAFEQWAGASHGLHRVSSWSSAGIHVSRDELALDIGIRAGERVADIGAGEGYFLDAFARRVGLDGRYTALEIDPNLVRHLDWYAEALGHKQVDTVLSPLDRPTLDPGAYDLVFICEVMKAVVTNHSASTPTGRARARRWLDAAVAGLAPGGRLVIVDHDFGDDPNGISFALLGQLLAEAGLPVATELTGYRGLNRVVVYRAHSTASPQ